MEKKKKIMSWDEYFISLAHLSAFRSKDPNTQVGAVIVDEKNRIVSIGYNGMPRGCKDNRFPWEREGGFLDTKYAFVVHAELNAILNSGTGDLRGTRVYVTLFPCEGCTKALIQKGIKEVIYADDKYHDLPGTMAARRMLDAAGVKYTKYEATGRKIEIDV